MNANKHLNTNFAKGLVLGLQEHGPSKAHGPRHIYYGTVPAAEVDRRRTKNRLARVARKVNRRTRKGQH